MSRLPSFRAATASVALAFSLAVAGCDRDSSPSSPFAPSEPSVPIPPGNRLPVVVSVQVEPSTLEPGQSADVRATVTDADGDRVECDWSSSAGGSFTAVSSDRCHSRWQAGATLGVVQLRVTARDARGASAEGQASVTVRDSRTGGGPSPTPSPDPGPGGGGGPKPQPSPSPTPSTNRPPVVQIVAASGSCNAPCEIQVTATASDPDGDRVSLSFGGCASGDHAGSTITVPCVVPNAGRFTASVTASDARGATAQASVDVSGVPSTNRPPTVSLSSAGASCHPRPADPCEVLVTATASDPDGDRIHYEWAGCAAGASGASASCRVTGLGTFNASVTVRDGRGASASSSVMITGVNAAPSATASAAAAGCHPYPNDCQVEVTATATDADGDRLTYAWSGCAAGALSGAKCTVPRLTLGNFPATVTIDDGWTSVTRTVSVRGWNTPPDVSASASAAGCHPRPGAPCVVPLTSTPSDADHDPVTVTWSGCADGTGTTAACEVHALGAHTATATATDPFGATRSVSVSVQGQNRAPVVSAAPAAGSGAAFPFTWSWSDADGDQLDCDFGIVQAAVCTFAGNCHNAGGSSSGSVGCQAKVEFGQDPSTRCDYNLACSDGWTSTTATFRLN
jgi:hypothetical protein